MKYCQSCGRKNEENAKFCVFCDYQFIVEKKEVEKATSKFTSKETIIGGIFGGIVLILGIALGVFLIFQSKGSGSEDSGGSPQNISKNVQNEFQLRKYEESFKEIEQLADKKDFKKAYEGIQAIQEKIQGETSVEEVTRKIFDVQKYVAQKEADDLANQKLEKERVEAENKRKEEEARAKLASFSDYLKTYNFRYLQENQHQVSLTISPNGSVEQVGTNQEGSKILKGQAVFYKMKNVKEIQTYSLNNPVRVVKGFVDTECQITFEDGQKKTFYGYINGDGKASLSDDEIFGKYLNEVWTSVD